MPADRKLLPGEGLAHTWLRVPVPESETAPGEGPFRVKLGEGFGMTHSSALRRARSSLERVISARSPDAPAALAAYGGSLRLLALPRAG